MLTDVCPYTLGTEVARRDAQGRLQEGFFAPIIQRNSAVPVSREQTFQPVNEGQQQLKLVVYQGESPLVANNIMLGELTLNLDPRRSVLENAVVVRFTYDVNGVLQVEAHIQATGERHELILQQSPGVLDHAQIQQRLAALDAIKVHPRGKQENLAVIARAERMYAEHLDWRDQLQEWIVHFRQALDTQDEALIRSHRTQLDSALSELEQRL